MLPARCNCEHRRTIGARPQQNFEVAKLRVGRSNCQLTRAHCVVARLVLRFRTRRDTIECAPNWHGHVGIADRGARWKLSTEVRNTVTTCY